MIDNNPSKSIRSIARNLGVSEFYISVLFLIQGPIFITSPGEQEERPCYKAFEQIQASFPNQIGFGFFQTRKISTGIRW